MPRDGSGIYNKPAGTTAVSGTTISSSDYNDTIDDLVTDANTPRPIIAGGTDATSATGARTNLGLGSIATQNSNSVTITGGTISGTTITGGSIDDYVPLSGGTMTGPLRFEWTQPSIEMYEADQPVDQRLWDFIANSGILGMTPRNDDGSTQVGIFQLTRGALGLSDVGFSLSENADTLPLSRSAVNRDRLDALFQSGGTAGVNEWFTTYAGSEKPLKLTQYGNVVGQTGTITFDRPFAGTNYVPTSSVEHVGSNGKGVHFHTRTTTSMQYDRFDTGSDAPSSGPFSWQAIGTDGG